MPMHHERFSAPVRAGIVAIAAANLAVGLAASSEERVNAQQVTHGVEPAMLRAGQSELVTPGMLRFTTTTDKGTEMRLAVPPTVPSPPQPDVTPSAEITPATVPAGVFAAACYEYQHLFAQYDWPLTGAMRTANEESSCRPDAVSDTNDHGIMQINDGLALYGEQIYDPEFNIRIAYQEKYMTPRRGRRPNFSAWFAVCTKGLRPLFKEVHCQ